MIVVTARMNVKPQFREPLRERVRVLAAQVPGEAGNLSYAYFEDALEPGWFFLFEQWRTEADLETHFRQPWVRAHFAAIEGWFEGPMELRRYEAEDLDERRGLKV